MAAGGGNLEENASRQMLQSWIKRAGYNNLDSKIDATKPTPKASAKTDVTKTAGGKREVSKITGIMANGLDDFVSMFGAG